MDPKDIYYEDGDTAIGINVRDPRWGVLQFTDYNKPMVTFAAGKEPGSLIASAPDHEDITLSAEQVIDCLRELARLAFLAPRKVSE